MTQLSQTIRRRTHQVSGLLSEHGIRHVAARALTFAARRWGEELSPMPVRMADVRAADLRDRRAPAVPSIPHDGLLTINWVTTPPAHGSGGHTTMFRLIQHLESAGHTCRVYLYDVYGNRAIDLEQTVRSAFPRFRGPVLDVTHGMADAHAVFASAWPTAYPVYNDPCAGERFYLVQDYEPWFYPVGGTAALAENTYRMGFHGFTAGRFLAEKLGSEHDMTCDWFDFGCDAEHYHLMPVAPRRDGIVFYARPMASRRAFELGRIALDLFSRDHPDLWIHLYGQRVGDLGPRFVDHGLVPPEGLNVIYNRCFAGLSLSMTNVSLVPHEMLAAGCIPVVNDARHNRMVLENDHVRYAPAAPHDLAAALSEVVAMPNFDARAASAAASVQGRSWTDAGYRLEKTLLRTLGA